jgi:VanZ family protein
VVTVKTDAPLDQPASVSAAPPPSFTAGLLRYWLPVILWCALIFGFSTDAGSTRRTSRILRPILRWFNADISDEAIRRAQFGVRKAAHVGEYAILALLVWRAKRKSAWEARRPWDWREAGLAFAFAAAFALTDEFHQALVPSREARVSDLLLDSLGAALGLLALRAYGRWRGRW